MAEGRPPPEKIRRAAAALFLLLEGAVRLAGRIGFSDPCHFSAAGSEKFARRLSGLVRERFLPSR